MAGREDARERERERERERRPREEAHDPEPSPLWWVTNYPKMLWRYWTRGEDGLKALEEELRSKAAARPEGKFGKREAAYVPFVPLPSADFRHECGRCRFWVDHGPGKAGECMIVGREGDPWGGDAIHEKAGCALFMPPAGESAFAWLREQVTPTGADLVRGEFHPTGERGGRRGGRGAAAGRRRERARRHPTEPDVGTSVAPAGAAVGVETVVEGLASPMAVVFDPAGDRRLVADQPGLVHVHGPDGLRDEPLLDLRDRVVELRAQYDERGLLGLALHPDDDRLFVRYSAPNRPGTPDEYDHTEVLAEYRLDDDRSQVDPETERTVLEIPSPQFNHNAGALAFDPDDYLYVAMGDGGSEGDRGPGHVPGGNGQDVTENLLGGILRIDVDDGGEGGYGIPDDNPFVDEDGRDEYYAWGLRNPWRMSFDSAGRLFVADVGQHLYEEVNVVETGGNYGWNVREGFHCFDPDNPSDPPADCPEESERGEPFRDPILEYPHVTEREMVGSAVVGGYVYEGDRLPALDGAYVFGDWATTQDRPSGRLFAARPDRDDRWTMEELVVAGSSSGRLGANVLSFARDPDGELYVCTNETHVPKGETGAVHRIVSA
jgi:glucose/arabinose dehydrogenase